MLGLIAIAERALVCAHCGALWIVLKFWGHTVYLMGGSLASAHKQGDGYLFTMCGFNKDQFPSLPFTMRAFRTVVGSNCVKLQIYEKWADTGNLFLIVLKWRAVLRSKRIHGPWDPSFRSGRWSTLMLLRTEPWLLCVCIGTVYKPCIVAGREGEHISQIPVAVDTEIRNAAREVVVLLFTQDTPSAWVSTMMIETVLTLLTNVTPVRKPRSL